MPQGRYYFTTRDLFMMAALAALGGITSTYINAFGDLVQSAVGFAGTTQWAAGLHVLWLVLAVGFVGKPGAGTVTGILKGAVELLTGNTHGLLVVLVDIMAGVLVDLGFLPFKKKQSLPPYLLAGGLGAASNVFVFQLFASLPADILAYGAILIVGLVAFLSGVLFAGILGFILLNALRKAGVVKNQEPANIQRSTVISFVIVALVLVVSLGFYLRMTLKGPAIVSISGAVERPYQFPTENGDIQPIEAEATLREVQMRYKGFPLSEIIYSAEPAPGAQLILLRASDDYAFFITMEELQTNNSLLLTASGDKDKASYDVVGPQNSKAWVRNISEIVVIALPTLEIKGSLNAPEDYDPSAWQFEMDSTVLDVGYGPNKYQGAPLSSVLEKMEVLTGANTVMIANDETQVELPLSQVLADNEIRIFSIMSGDQMSFALARMNGEVILSNLTAIEVR